MFFVLAFVKLASSTSEDSGRSNVLATVADFTPAAVDNLPRVISARIESVFALIPEVLLNEELSEYMTPVDRISETLSRFPKLLGQLMIFGGFSTGSDAVKDILAFNEPELAAAGPSGVLEVIRAYLACARLPLCKYLPAALRPRYREFLLPRPSFTVSYFPVTLPENTDADCPNSSVYATLTPTCEFTAVTTDDIEFTYDDRLLIVPNGEDDSTLMFVDLTTGASASALANFQPSIWLPSKRYLALGERRWFADSSAPVTVRHQDLLDMPASTVSLFMGERALVYSLDYPSGPPADVPALYRTRDVLADKPYGPRTVTCGTCLIKGTRKGYVPFTQASLLETGKIRIYSNVEWLLLKSFKLWLKRASDDQLRQLRNPAWVKPNQRAKAVKKIVAAGDAHIWRLLQQLMEGQDIRKTGRWESLMDFLPRAE